MDILANPNRGRNHKDKCSNNSNSNSNNITQYYSASSITTKNPPLMNQTYYDRSLMETMNTNNNNTSHRSVLSHSRIPWIGLTATASQIVCKDIIHNLQLDHPYIIIANFDRKNLKFIIQQRTNNANNDVLRLLIKKKNDFDMIQRRNKSAVELYNKSMVDRDKVKDGDDGGSDKEEEEEGWIETHNPTQHPTHNPTQHPTHNVSTNTLLKTPSSPVPYPSTLIYVKSRQDAEDIVNSIATCVTLSGVGVSFYHAGMSTKDREHVHSSFILDQTPIVVATIAFGMGIHKPDVRLIIHIGR